MQKGRILGFFVNYKTKRAGKIGVISEQKPGS
jgi:hypothetical protein